MAENAAERTTWMGSPSLHLAALRCATFVWRAARPTYFLEVQRPARLARQLTIHTVKAIAGNVVILAKIQSKALF
jgi:hypothetical protein